LTKLFLFGLVALTAFGFQPPGPPPAAGAKPAPRARPTGFPERPPADPASVERGKALYGVHCTFCHGADARGGSGGPNLIRHATVLNDKEGELIGPVLREGREGMPRIDVSATQVKDIANFIHSFRVGGYDVSRMTPPTIVVGNAQAGQAYFAKTCASCHSATGDLKGLATRIADEKVLQQTWIMPGSGRGFPGAGGGGAASRVSPTTVTVTLANGKKFEGRLLRMDDFLVALAEKDGTQRSFSREGATPPQVEVKDPLAPHKKLLSQYQDTDIHNLTAYLVTLK